MKRNLMLIAGVFLAVLAILLMGNVITVGEKLGEIFNTVYAEYAFYVLILLLAVIFVVGPVIRVHSAPEFPALNVDGESDASELLKFGRKLASNCMYIEDEEKRKEHQTELGRELQLYSADASQLRQLLDREVMVRFNGDPSLGVKGIDSKMKEWAKSVFLITALSQNSLIDSAVVMVMNYRQIEDLVLATGFRPSRSQMFRLYAKILTTALISYCTSEIVSDLAGETSLTGALSALKIPGVVTESAVQGAVNALLTLRIGYVAQTCLREGPDALAGRRRRDVSLQAFRAAFASIPSVLAGTASAVGKGLAGLVRRPSEE